MPTFLIIVGTVAATITVAIFAKWTFDSFVADNGSGYKTVMYNSPVVEIDGQYVEVNALASSLYCGEEDETSKTIVMKIDRFVVPNDAG